MVSSDGVPPREAPRTPAQTTDICQHTRPTANYPSAPVGDANSLPTSMLTDEEKKKAWEKEHAAEAKAKRAAERKAKAAAKAPTVDGTPIRLRIVGDTRKGKLAFETQKEAEHFVDRSFDAAAQTTLEGAPRNRDRSAYDQEQIGARYMIEKLSEKQGVSRAAIIEKLRDEETERLERSRESEASIMEVDPEYSEADVAETEAYFDHGRRGASPVREGGGSREDVTGTTGARGSVLGDRVPA